MGEQAKHRNSMRKVASQVPSSVIDSMAERLEPPRPLVQPWEELSFTLNSVDGEPVNVEVVEAFLAAARKRPVQPLPDTKVQLGGCRCLKSVVDQEEEERKDS